MKKRIVKPRLPFPRGCSWPASSIGTPPSIITPSLLSFPERKISCRFRRQRSLFRRSPLAASLDHGENARQKEERGEGGKDQPADHRAAQRLVLLGARAE